jgi:hypothetical protein
MSDTDRVLEDVVSSRNKEPETLNKAAAIRKALQVTSSETKPSEITEYLKREHNIDVSPAYVSMIKSQLMKRVNNHPYETLRLAKKLIRETGSASAAKLAIEAVLEENEMTEATRNRYTAQMAEIELRLGDEEKPLDAKDRRELGNEKRKITKLLEALEEF